MKRYIIKLCALLGIALVQSCTKDESETAPAPAAFREVTMVVEIPGLQTPKSRSMDGAKENYVNEVDVLVFDVNDSDPSNVAETFREHVNGNVVSNSTAGSSYKVELKARLTDAANSRVVIVANAAAQVAAAVSGIPAGTPKKTVLERLKYASASWAASGTGGTFQPIPMYGETGKVNITFGAKFEGIQLKRMAARIDVINAAGTFMMEKIYLCNYNTIGYIAPKWRTNDGQILTSSGYPGPNLPADPGLQPGAIVFTPPGQSFTGEIYTQESAAASDAGESERRDATCLVIEGLYNGMKNFYRVDFTCDGTNGPLNQYMPLLRNYKYEVTIVSAGGPGYGTFEGALESYTVPSNLKTRILSYDMSVIKDIDFNGQNMLGVSQSSFLLPAAAISSATAANKLSVYTDYTQGWEVSGIEGEGDGNMADWLTLSAMSGPGGTITGIYIFLDENAGPVRSAYIRLKSGRLTHTIVVTQQ